MMAQSKDANVPDDTNLAKQKRELGEVSHKIKKAALEARITRLELEVHQLKILTSVLSNPRQVQRDLADKQRELAECRAQLKREFPETDRRWWHALLFWRKS